MTLAIHLVGSTVWGCRIARVLKVVVAILLELLNATGRSLVLAWNLSTWLVANWGKLNRSTTLLITGSGGISRLLAFSRDSGSSGTLLVGLALILLFLLPSLPLLSNLFEFCNDPESVY